MKKLLAILLCLTLCLAAAPVLAQSAPLSPGIILPANPTTGYQWMAVSSDEAVLQIEDLGLVSSDSAMLGAGGTQNFRLNGLTAGLAEATFTYGRSWEDSALYTFVYRIQVDENLNVQVLEMEMK